MNLREKLIKDIGLGRDCGASTEAIVEKIMPYVRQATDKIIGEDDLKSDKLESNKKYVKYPAYIMKCERCLEIKPLVRYTFVGEEKIIHYKEFAGYDKNGDRRIIAKTSDLTERKGLCEECSKEVAKYEYDKKLLGIS